MSKLPNLNYLDMFSFLPGENKKFWIPAVHAAVWIFFIFLLYGANWIAKPDTNIGKAFLSMIPYIVVFYVSLFWIKRYRRLGPILSIISFFGTFIILATVGYVYMYHALPKANVWLFENDQMGEFLKYAILGYIQYYVFALLYFVATGFYKKEIALRLLQEEKFIKELENAKLKERELQAQKEKLQIEYAFLRAQVNPHFLHNTLNALYSQAQEYSDDLADNILKVSRMMRYSFENINQESDLVPISKELKNLKLLIEINDVRYDGQSIADLQILGEPDDQMVPPLSLITIVENAFKYGDLTDPQFPILIRVILEPGSLSFLCRNKISPNAKNNTSHKVGISNLKKRLEVLFDKKHTMTATEEDGIYTFELTIKD